MNQIDRQFHIFWIHTRRHLPWTGAQAARHLAISVIRQAVLLAYDVAQAPIHPKHTKDVVRHTRLQVIIVIAFGSDATQHNIALSLASDEDVRALDLAQG